MKNYIIAIIFISLLLPNIKASEDIENTNPFSKITITSQQATCEKSKTNNQFIINYQKSVKVELADKSFILADNLEIALNELPQDSASTKKQEDDDSFSKFEKIIFTGNIKLKQNNRNLCADKIEVLPKNKRCIISGNIKVEQEKSVKKDIPIVAEGDRAIIDMNTNEITFLGSANKPVSTTITIEGYPNLLKKVKTKQEKKELKKAQKKLKQASKTR